MLGASREVLTEHADRHVEEFGCPDVPPFHLPCPHGMRVALLCGACGRALFLVVDPEGDCACELEA